MCNIGELMGSCLFGFCFVEDEDVFWSHNAEVEMV